MPELDDIPNHPKTGQLRLASSQMQVAGIRAWSPKLSTVRAEPGDSAEEVCEIANSLERPSCLSNANAISRKVFCSLSLSVLTSNHLSRENTLRNKNLKKSLWGLARSRSVVTGKHAPTSRVNPGYTFSKTLLCARKGLAFIRMPLPHCTWRKVTSC